MIVISNSYSVKRVLAFSGTLMHILTYILYPTEENNNIIVILGLHFLTIKNYPKTI